MMLLNYELKQTISSFSFFCQEIVLSPCQEKKKLRLSHIPMFAFAIFLSWCPSKKSLQDHEPFPYTFFYQFTGSCLMFKSLVLSVSHLGPLWFIETLGLLFYFFKKCCLTFDRDCMGSVDCLLCVNILIIFTLWVIKQRVHRSYLISLVIKKTLGIQLPNVFRWALII